jgi:hypothetical protein
MPNTLLNFVPYKIGGGGGEAVWLPQLVHNYVVGIKIYCPSKAFNVYFPMSGDSTNIHHVSCHSTSGTVHELFPRNNLDNYLG